MKKACHKYLTTPLWAYVAALVVAVILIIISTINPDDDLWWKALLVNLGYGIIASAFVSLMIDIGNTKRKHEQDSIMFSRMVADLKYECLELPSEMYTAVYEVFGYNQVGKYTFTEWTEKLFTMPENPSKTKQVSEITYVLQTVSEIRKKSCELIEVMKISLPNEFFTDDYVKNVKELINICFNIERANRSESYINCKCLILENLVPRIKFLFKDISNDYERAYNEEDYI